MGDILITAPAAEVVTVDELRAHLRDCSDADAVLERLIKAAREYVEEATGLALVSQTRKLSLDCWPISKGDGLGWWDGVRDGALIGLSPRSIELPRAPLISIDHVKTYDNAGNATTFSSSNYFADTGSRPGRLSLLSGATWPIPERPAAGIEIQYRAGHANAAAVPNVLAVAILQLAAHWYENRELVDLEGPEKVPLQTGRIISKFRIAKL